MMITEADHAVARRVIRRIAGAKSSTPLFMFDPCHIDPNLYATPKLTPLEIGGAPFVVVQRNVAAEAVEAAAQGRAYAKALRTAR